MKRLGLYFSTLLCAVALQAQTTDYPELLSNPGFEESSISPFGGVTTFEDWTLPLGAAVAETADKQEGEQAMKINQATQKVNHLDQEVFDYATQPEEGAAYEMRIRYKVLASQAGEDIKLMYLWSSSRDGELTKDSTSWLTGNEWKTQTLRTVCPAGASRFLFRVKFSKGVEVLLDDFSFRKVDDEPVPAEPSLTITPAKMPAAETALGTSVQLPVITVVQNNFTAPMTFDIIGKGRAAFSFTTTAKSETATEVQITYNPAEAAMHDAMLTIDVPSKPELSETYSLHGICIDPKNPPVVTVTPESLPTFETTARQEQKATLKLSSTGCVDYVYAGMRHIDNAGFVVNSTTFIKNMPQDVTVTFRPTKAGYYRSQLRFWSLKSDTVTITLIGNAKPATEDPNTFTTAFSWHLENPQSLLVEDFNLVEHNYDLQLEGWQNVVLGGERPWWGYYHRDAQLNILEKTAKATGYQYQVPAEERSEMWMVTPALDYKNAKGRTFTLRVMGDFMFEGHDTELSVWLIDSVPGDRLYFRKIDGMGIPTAPDYNGEWMEYHVNLDEQEIEDVFFIGFKYDGLFGQENAVTYYIDDVSWGRTDLPAIQADSAQVVMTAALGKDAASGMITVKTSNLTEPVTLSLGGNNKSKFQLSANTLPAEGGTFQVLFNSDQEGVHEAYVKLSSRGAADLYIPMAVLCKTGTAVENPGAEALRIFTAGRELHVTNAAADYTVYDTTGRTIYTGNAAHITLPMAGVYVVRCAAEVRKLTVF